MEVIRTEMKSLVFAICCKRNLPPLHLVFTRWLVKSKLQRKCAAENLTCAVVVKVSSWQNYRKVNKIARKNMQHKKTKMPCPQ